MKFIQKISYIFINLYFILLLFYFLYNKEVFFESFKTTIILWFEKLVPSISTSYILSIFLVNFPLVSYIIYPFFRKVYNFENRKSCSLFLVSIIVGNPTSTKLINNAVNNNEISITEGNRLLKYSCFISTPFLYSIFEFNIFILILILELITSLIVSKFNYNKIDSIHTKQSSIYNHSILSTYFDIINSLPTLLLSILSSMLICNLISLLIPNSYIKSLFEITSGINILVGLNQSFLTFCIINILIFSHGFAIILQVYWILKKSSLSFSNFIKYRLFSVIISLINLIIIYLFIFFF